LDSLTTYYWRVNATNAAGTSDWSNTWSFTTTTVATPAAPTLASPSNGATGVSTAPTLGWNASSGATSYRLQVSASSTFSSPVVDQSGITGNSYPVSGLANSMLHYWRVNATNAGGTSDWSSTWIFTTAVAAPASPSLASPSNGATGISTSPTLSWSPSAGATSYRLQVSIDSNFSALALNQSAITGSSYAVSGLGNGTTYYWRIDATNSGGTSEWSSTWSFTTVLAIPTPPTLVSPPHGGVFTSDNGAMLIWNPSGGAATYRLQLSRSQSFPSAFVDTSALTETSCVVLGLTVNTTYYWRVCAGNTAGTSDWSSVWRFTLGGAASVEVLNDQIAEQFSLSDNYPNPFNPSTSIYFSLAHPGYTALKVFDVFGREVATLVSQALPAGQYRVNWNALGMASGVYLYRLQAGPYVETKKMLLLK
jgi:hypothetical protein